MMFPDWRAQVYNPGILPEPVADKDRLVLWLPGERTANYQEWQRLGTLPQAEVQQEQSLAAIQAAVVSARQKMYGFAGGLLVRFLGKSGGQAWSLPNGETAEQHGERRTDLLLVWGTDPETPLDETTLRGRWPQATRIQPLGPNLFVLWGIEPRKVAPPPDPNRTPRELAEQAIADARQTGNRQAEAVAMTDLGLLLLRENEVQKGVALLDEARPLLQALKDQAGEGEIAGALGLVAAGQGQLARAFELFQQELNLGRQAKARQVEQSALTHLGLYYSHQGKPDQALPLFEEALKLSRQAKDQLNEPEILWQTAIAQADLGRRDEATATAQQAVALLEKVGNPQASVYADHLRKFQATQAAAPVGTPGGLMAAPGFSGVWISTPVAAPAPAASGPSFLRMATSAAKAMGKFVGSGFQKLPVEIHQQRLRVCGGCDQHTGVRCRMCGCFTTVKAWLPHEDCPAGKWPPVPGRKPASK